MVNFFVVLNFMVLVGNFEFVFRVINEGFVLDSVVVMLWCCNSWRYFVEVVIVVVCCGWWSRFLVVVISRLGCLVSVIISSVVWLILNCVLLWLICVGNSICVFVVDECCLGIVVNRWILGWSCSDMVE